MASPEVEAVLKLRDELSPQLSGVQDKVSGLGGFFKQAGATMVGFLGADIVRNVKDFIGESMNLRVEEDRLEKQTAAVVRSTGGAANVTAGHIRDLAESISGLSGVDHMAIMNGENLLLTFTQIQNRVGDGNDIFDQATRAVTNMSVALGEDAQSAAIQLGKALQDPVTGVTSLRRVGVMLTEAQQDQIKAFVESGDVMSAQKIILRELATEFGGSAEAFGTSAAGMKGKVTEAVEDARLALADTLMPLLADIAPRVVEAARAFAGWVEANRPLIAQIVDFAGRVLAGLANVLSIVIPAAIAIVRGVFDGLRAVIAWFGENIPVLAGVLAGIGIVLGATVIPALVAWAVATWAQVAALAAQAVAVIAAYWPLLLLAAGIAVLVAAGVWLVQHWSDVQAFATRVWNAIKDFVLGVWNAILAAAVSVWGAIRAGIVDPIQSAWHWLTSAWASIRGFVETVWRAILELARTVWSGIQHAVTDPMGTVLGAVQNIWNGITGWLGDAWNGLISTARNIFGQVVGAIVGAFQNMHIPLPHISFRGIDWGQVLSGNLGAIIDAVSISWYQMGGVFMRPRLVGVGDVPEAVIPLSRLPQLLAPAAAGGPLTVIVELDSRQIAKAILPEMVGEIRVRTGYRG